MHMILKTVVVGGSLLLSGTVLADAQNKTMKQRVEDTRDNIKDKANEARYQAEEAGDEVTEDMKEAVLHTKVRMALLRNLTGADSLRVRVSVKGTTAYLTGQVQGRSNQALAETAARSVDGIKIVKSSITLNPRAAVEDNADSRMKDAQLAGEVKMKLLEEVGDSALKIHVVAKDGVVRMRGTVGSNVVKSRAEECAAGVSGVTRVDNGLNSN